MYLWKQHPREPSDLAELSLVAEGLADLKDEAARPYIEKLRVYFPGEADALNARLLWRQGQKCRGGNGAEATLRSYQSDLFMASRVMQRSLRLAVDMSRDHHRWRRAFYRYYSSDSRWKCSTDTVLDRSLWPSSGAFPRTVPR